MAIQLPGVTRLCKKRFKNERAANMITITTDASDNREDIYKSKTY